MEQNGLMKVERGMVDVTDAEYITAIRSTVCKDLNDGEFKFAIEVIKATKLNPIKKEIWFIKDNQGRLQVMTGIYGFYEIANRNAQMDGLESGLISEKGEWVKTCTGKWIGAWARVHRKDRKIPFEADVLFSEFGKAFANWKVMPSYMIKKVAEAHALRKSFPQELAGLNADVEMSGSYQQDPEAEMKATFEIANAPKAKLPDTFGESGDQRTDAEIRKASALYRYDISKSPRKEDAQKLLEKAKAVFDNDELCWFSDVAIKPLEKYLKAGEGAEL